MDSLLSYGGAFTVSRLRNREKSCGVWGVGQAAVRAFCAATLRMRPSAPEATCAA